MHIYTTPYTYDEYPKWVRTETGDILVQSREEEEKVTHVVPVKRRGRPPKEENPLCE